MAKEEPQSELTRLLREQEKTRRDEVFGGLTPAERAEYKRKAERIQKLESEIQASAVAENSSQVAKAEQKRQWNKESETDTPQGEAHQPYRSREKDSMGSSTDSNRRRGKAKKAPEEQGGE
jgi:hypothetical protein